MATVPIRDILDNETGEPIFPRTHVKAVIGLADSNFFEEYIDGNGARSVKLRSDYVGLWTEGWISNGGIGGNGGGGGGGAISGVYIERDLGSIYSPGGTEDITKTFSAFAIDKIWQTVLGVQQSIPIVSLNNGASYSTLVINGTTADFYTKAQVDGLISGIHSFEPVPVQTLPTASADTMYKLYLVPSEDPQSQNIKDEYITYRTGSEGNYTYSWEKVGSTAIDLTGYATESWVNQQGFLTASALNGYATQTWANQQFLKKTGGDISGDIFHQIEEEDVDSGEITFYELWKITENGDATFESLSVNGVDFSTINSHVNTLWNARNNYVTLSGAQTISGAKTFSGGITMSGSDIVPSADNTVSIGTNDLRVNSAFLRNIYTSFLQFREGTTKTPIGQIAFGVGYSQLSILGNNAKDFMYYPDKFFASGGNADLGLSDHRWSNIYGVNANLAGDLALASTSHIDIGPARIEFDATSGAIHVTTNQTGNNAPVIGFYADGFNATGGIGNGGGGGGFGVEQITTNQDGTIDFHFTGGDITTVDLNHEHPQYPKYVHLSSESEMPANPDPDTMYIIDGGGGGGGSYTLPIASASTLGGIKVGTGLSIDSTTGVLSATGGSSYTLPTASASTLGGVKVGDGLSIDSGTGVLSTATKTVYLTSESQMPATPDANTLYVILES